MPRWFFLVALAVMIGACSSASVPTTTAPAPTTTTTTLSPRVGKVPSPAAILAAVESHDLDQATADMYLTFAMFSQPDLVPLDYLVPIGDEPFSQWDHSFLTRLVAMWTEIAGEDQVELLNAVDGLDELVDRPGVQGIRSGGADGCIPVVSVDVLVCVGGSVSQLPVAGLPLDEAVTVVRPWVRDAAQDAWTKFETLFGSEPNLVKIFLSNLTATGGYTYGVVPASQPEEQGGICHVYLDVMIPDETDGGLVYLDDATIPDGVPQMVQLQATVAHELFHCFQREALAGFDATLWEGSATWAEHHVYPAENTEIPWMTTWVSDPDKPFAGRLYDTSFAFVYADLVGAGSDSILDVLTANSIADLDAMFEDLWHDISVSAWNQDPVAVLVNDGSALIPAEVTDWGTYEITAEAEETMDFSVPLYSRDIQTLEFSGGTSVSDLADFARLWVDLSQVPDDVKVSAIAETTDGWLDPVRLVGAEWQFCRVAIGACNDADRESIHRYTRVVLIVTNVDNGTESFSIPWETYNPHLDGNWTRTQGPFLTNPGATAPYGIVGTRLGFSEQALSMSEETAGYSLANPDPGWECTFDGRYTVGADPAYGDPEFGNVDGTVTVIVDEAGEGETFTNDCVFTSADGFDTSVGGLHIPVVASPTETFGFEIRDYDTLWIYAFERIYVYERVE